MHAVHFPEDRTVGQLMRVVRQQVRERWEDITDAQGTLLLPVDEQLILALDNTTDLAPLDDVHPDALWGLQLWKLFTLHDEELRHVGRLTGLRYLSLGDAWQITDAGVVHLAGLVHLEHLDLTETAVTDTGLCYLAALANLRALALWGTRVGDAGLPHLRVFRHLESLDLRYTTVSDQGVAALASLSGLKTLDIAGTGITPSGVASLQGVMPHCAIATS